MRILTAAASWDGVATARSLAAEGLLVGTAETWPDLLYMASSDAHDAVLYCADLPQPRPARCTGALRKLREVQSGVLAAVTGGDAAPLFDAGADVVVRPDEPARVLARRLRAAVLRRRGHVPPCAQAGGLAVDVMARTVRAGSRPVALTPLQYEIVERLALSAGRTVSRDTLLDALYGWENEPGARVLDTFLHDIRRRVAEAGGDAQAIRTRRGAGFLLAPQSGAEAPMRRSA